MGYTPYAIFDMDGTLLDSTGMWDLVADRVLARWGMRFPRADRLDNMVLTIQGTAAYYVEHYGLPADPGQVAELIRAEAKRAYTGGEASLKPGADRVIRALSDAGVRLCVASGTDKPLVDAALAHFGLLDRFEFTLSCQTPQGKQSPEVYLRALHAFGDPEPGQVTVFEDSPTALATARSLGVRTVAVWDAFTADSWADMPAYADDLCENWPAWLARAASIQEECTI